MSSGVLKPSEVLKQKRIAGFRTSFGSIYVYDKDGTSRRYRASADEIRPPKDLTVFLDPNDENYRNVTVRVASIMIGEGLTRLNSSSGRFVRHINDIQDPENIHAVLLPRSEELEKVGDNVGAVATMGAGILPTIGHHPLQASYNPDGSPISVHLGDPVVRIYYDHLH